MATIIVIGLLAGFLIGSIGIGGVIIVPALTYILNVDIQLAIATALMGFILSGIVGTFQYQKLGSIHWQSARVLIIAAVPTALLGSLAIQRISPLTLTSLIGCLAALSGFQAIFGGNMAEKRSAPALSSARLAALGAFTSFFSTASGTGGPLILIPLLMWHQQPVLRSVGLGQVIQLPISFVATLSNMAMGAVDWYLGGALAVTLSAGCWFGASIAHRVPARILKTGVSYVLVLLGCVIVAEVIIKLIY